MANTFHDNSPEHVGAYNMGAFARLRGESLGMNPHDEGTGLHDAWRSGWMRVPTPLTSGKLCLSCKGTGADIARTLAAPASDSGYVRCVPCNGNGLDPAEYFRFDDYSRTQKMMVLK